MSPRVEDWGFQTNSDGRLVIGGIAAEQLADRFGTPLHVVDEPGLRRRAARLRQAFTDAYPGTVTPYYAMKANNTPGIVQLVLAEGFRPEVGTLYEWELSRRLGYAPDTIMINGPNKGPLLARAIADGVGLIVIDSLDELDVVQQLASNVGRVVDVLLRINPNCVPRGMNRASATGSRTQSVFGLDLESGEVAIALLQVATLPNITLAGFHCHVGTGIQRAKDYRKPLTRLVRLMGEARQCGLDVSILDIGGGFGVSTSRELDTIEFLRYQALGHLPRPPEPNRFPPIESFATTIAQTIHSACLREGLPLPRLLMEPGRAIVSAADVLLLRVGAVKTRSGVGTWVITDGAAGTVAFPLFYEYHEVFVCRAAAERRTMRYTIVGPVCFSADWVYRNKPMPPIVPGDVLAVCDAGAYFTVQESNFGFPRPPIVSVNDGEAKLLRRRETFDDMVARDLTLGVDHARDQRLAAATKST